MRPSNLATKIFLDGGDPSETKEIIRRLGFLDGQTTNPTLIAKNPDAQQRLREGKKFASEEILNFYRGIVEEISALIPAGSVSVEVYADRRTDAKTMFNQGREMYSWIPNAHIKYPTAPAGLEAAERSIQAGMRVNMTLVFSQEQAAAVYVATQGAKKGDVFVSPFVGRLDDKGENGMDLIQNILAMYQNGDNHVEVLTASVRTMDHFLYALKLRSDSITAPLKILKAWAEQGRPVPGDDFIYPSEGLRKLPYKEMDLSGNWRTFNLKHELTDQGIDRFSEDWNALLRHS